jgi:8-oxo-dGTP diphosphatase
VSGSVIPCVGAVIKDARGRLLLIKRGHAPGAGLWSLPGGRIEPGETDTEALMREIREETGLEIEAGRLIGTVRRPGPGGDVFDIRDYSATVTGGILSAGDDAADARWVDATELKSLPITEGLTGTLADWGVLGLGGIDRPSFTLDVRIGQLCGLMVYRRLSDLIRRIGRFRPERIRRRYPGPRRPRPFCARPRRSSRRRA